MKEKAMKFITQPADRYNRNVDRSANSKPKIDLVYNKCDNIIKSFEDLNNFK